MKKHLLLLGITFLSYNFATAQCEAVSYLNETFGGESLPECWTGSHNYPNIMTGDEITFYSGGSGALDIYLVSPEITEFNGQQTLSFTAAGTSMSPVLQVGTLEIADDFSTFVAVGDEIALGEENTYSVSFPASETQKFIAFRFTGGAPHAAATLDDVLFGASAPSCEPVSALNETFDAGPLPDCWSASHNYPNVMGEDNITFYSGGSGALDIYVVSPEITEFNGQQTLSFTAAGTSMSPVLQVGTLEIADDFSTFVAVGDEIALVEENTYSVSFPASETQKFIAFRFNAGGAPHAAATLDDVVFQATASVATVEKNSFKIYPNPATSVLNITGNYEIRLVEIFDMTGRKVAVSATADIDVTSLNSGTYILNITTEQGTSQSKFIKK